jgi:hypothetical protein
LKNLSKSAFDTAPGADSAWAGLTSHPGRFRVETPRASALVKHLAALFFKGSNAVTVKEPRGLLKANARSRYDPNSYDPNIRIPLQRAHLRALELDY